jgi:iron complex outermembrane receptor protein
MFYRRLARLGVTCVLFSASWAHAQVSQAPLSTAEIQIVVRSDSGPIPRAPVIVGGNTTLTDAEGGTTQHVAPGPVDITVVKEGFNPVTVSATATLGPAQVIPIVFERQTAIEEHVTVSATRTDKRIEDQPMRVEVVPPRCLKPLDSSDRNDSTVSR